MSIDKSERFIFWFVADADTAFGVLFLFFIEWLNVIILCEYEWVTFADRDPRCAAGPKWWR
jgi:hypothetical protein